MSPTGVFHALYSSYFSHLLIFHRYQQSTAIDPIAVLAQLALGKIKHTGNRYPGSPERIGTDLLIIQVRL